MFFFIFKTYQRQLDIGCPIDSNGMKSAPHRVDCFEHRLTIGWLVGSSLAKLHKNLPLVTIRQANLTTQNIVEGLRESTLDFGITRADGQPANLGTFDLGTGEYALIVPRNLLSSKQPPLDFLRSISTLPIATQASGSQFASHLRDTASREGIRLCLALECESFPQAMGALRTGH